MDIIPGRIANLAEWPLAKCSGPRVSVTGHPSRTMYNGSLIFCGGGARYLHVVGSNIEGPGQQIEGEAQGEEVPRSEAFS